METYYKTEAEYWKKQYEETRKDLTELNFQIGWLKSSLNRLGSLIESGGVTVNRYHTSEVQSIVKAIEESEIRAKAYAGK